MPQSLASAVTAPAINKPHAPRRTKPVALRLPWSFLALILHALILSAAAWAIGRQPASLGNWAYASINRSLGTSEIFLNQSPGSEGISGRFFGGQ